MTELTTNNQSLSQHTTPSLKEHTFSLLKNDRIDWNGSCEFDEDGKFVSFTNPNNPRNQMGLKPIPKYDVDSQVKKELSEARKSLDDMIRPPDKNQFSTMITKLGLHCGMQQKKPESVKAMLRDYWEDFGDYPLFLIEKACQKYRKMEEGNKFMPNSGKMISMMYEENYKLKKLSDRLNRLLGEDKPNNSEKRQNGIVHIEDILNRV